MRLVTLAMFGILCGCFGPNQAGTVNPATHEIARETPSHEIARETPSHEVLSSTLDTFPRLRRLEERVEIIENLQVSTNEVQDVTLAQISDLVISTGITDNNLTDLETDVDTLSDTLRDTYITAVINESEIVRIWTATLNLVDEVESLWVEVQANQTDLWTLQDASEIYRSAGCDVHINLMSFKTYNTTTGTTCADGLTQRDGEAEFVYFPTINPDKCDYTEISVEYTASVSPATGDRIRVKASPFQDQSTSATYADAREVPLGSELTATLGSNPDPSMFTIFLSLESADPDDAPCVSALTIKGDPIE